MLVRLCSLPSSCRSRQNRYEIFKCTGLIELQTSSHSYEKNIPSDPDAMDGFGAEPVTETCEVRPDIYINPKDERELFITRKAADINNTDSYEMVCEAPRVEIMYDKKKQYCPKYQVRLSFRISDKTIQLLHVKNPPQHPSLPHPPFRILSGILVPGKATWITDCNHLCTVTFHGFTGCPERGKCGG